MKEKAEYYAENFKAFFIFYKKKFDLICNSLLQCYITHNY